MCIRDRIQPTSATQSVGLSKSSPLRGPTNFIPVCGRASPSLRRGWTNPEPWCNINNSLGLTQPWLEKSGLVNGARIGFYFYLIRTFFYHLFGTLSRKTPDKDDQRYAAADTNT